MSFLRFVAIALCIALIVPQAGLAQVPGLGATANEPLLVNILPQYPRPYDYITITPSSTLIDLAAARVVISVNGEVIEEGSGSRPATARVGAAGSRTTVRVVATDAAGTAYVKEVVLRPADAALIIDSTSTVHPFYEGGRLVAAEGRVRLVAIPDFRTEAGTPIAPQNLVYSWKHGDRILQEQSGIGRSVLDATAPVIYRDARIVVTISTQDKSINATAAVTVSPINPLVRVYQKSPLLGSWYEGALPSEIVMNGAEETFLAVPYFFRNVPAITWTVNGAIGERDPDLTLRITETGRGTARVGVSAEEEGGLQSADTTFSVDFSSSRGGIFGL